MKHGILVGIGVFALSVIGAAVAATAYFKYRQSQIFDEYEEELANDDYYSAKVEPTEEKSVVVEISTEVKEADDEIVEDDEIEFADDEIIEDDETDKNDETGK